MNAVWSALESRTTDEDLCTLLHIIGKAGNQSLAAIVSRYLTVGLDDPSGDDDNSNDMFGRLAIQILGQWWKRGDVFESVAKAAFEDPSPLARWIAASTLGDLGLEHAELRSQPAALLLKGLERYGKEDRHVWGAFYNGALTLAEVEWSKRPLRPHELTPERLDEMVLKKVQSYAGRREWSAMHAASVATVALAAALAPADSRRPSWHSELSNGCPRIPQLSNS